MSLRLVLDLQATQSPEHGDRGVARYVREQAKAIIGRGRAASVLLNPLLPFPARLDHELLTSPLLDWNTKAVAKRVAAASDDPLAYYLMSPFELSSPAEGVLPPHLIRAGVPLITTLFDLIPLVLAERYLALADTARRYHARAELLHQTDLILTISEHTRQDALRLLELPAHKVVNIGGGVAPFFHPRPPEVDSDDVVRQAVPTVNRPYVLSVSGADARKNTEGLLDAWAALPTDIRREHQLVITCSVDPGTRETWSKHAEAAGLTGDDVTFTGWLPDETVRALYQSARLSVVPSLYEGFGLPVVEAIACGAPTVTSGTSSLPEILEWEPSTFDPADPESIAGVVGTALRDDAFRAELKARGDERAPLFTWDGVAQRTLDAIDRLVPIPSATPLAAITAGPVRVALIGPMPPARSGIADYNARLLGPLARRCQLDVFTDPDCPRIDVGVDSMRWFPIGAISHDVNPWQYDCVVYTAGNSEHHHELYEAAKRIPGLLWMHDVRIPGLYTTYALDRFPGRSPKRAKRFLAEKVIAQYAERTPAALAADPPLVPEPYVTAGVGLTREIASPALGVVVSSSHAARLLQLDQGPGTRQLRTWVLPLGAAPPSAPSTARAPAAAPVLLSIGILAPIKAPELLIATTALLRARGVPATLALVGPGTEDYISHLRDLAGAHGVTDAVEVTGSVSKDELERRLAEATIALQLRLTSNGESSAAVMDCLSAGTPVLTNMVAAHDIAPGAVDLLPLDLAPEPLADHLQALLADGHRLRRLGDLGRRAASDWSMDAVAERLMGIVAELIDE